MKRSVTFALLFAPALFVYACSSDKTEDPPPNDNTPEGGPGTPDSPKPNDDAGTDSPTDPDSSNPNTNPIMGIGTPTAVAIFNGLYTEGPVWRGDSLYVAEYKSPGGVLIKHVPPAANTVFRNVVTATDLPLGTTFDEKTNTFVTCEVTGGGVSGGSLIRTTLAGVATPIALTFDAGGNVFDSPNDVVARKSDGTLYVTDPGYQGAPAINHIWRITPTGAVFEIALAGRPNGIALSPDDKTLYVSFTDPQVLPPEILKYPVNTDGSLGPSALFAKLPPVDSAADGVAVDSNGNVYAAVKDGVEVFKSDGTKWGKITTPKGINGLAFGGADKKTLYMTANGSDPVGSAGVYQVVVKVPGLAQ
ncbi:MAG: SMP-30/gluconolactonase/LRE family protein [Labilithrix sp.]|nr:SMP-30/gluconolactonase/LRE family protein [Labilithrix sp.]